MGVIKKSFIVCILLVVLMQWGQAGLIGDFFQSEKYLCSMHGNGWQADASGRKKLVIFKHPTDGISEVSLDVTSLAIFRAKSAKEVAIARVEAYDSWVYVGGRQLEGWEIGNANASDGFIVMYTKNLFNKDSGSIKVLVTEKYFIKEGNAYIVTILSSSNAWYAAKDTLLKIANSFKIN